MAPLMDPFPSATTLRSQLISNPPSTIPSVAELVALEEELKLLQARADKRVKKADTDIRTLEAVRRKLKEKDKDSGGKVRDKDPKEKNSRSRLDAEEFTPQSTLKSTSIPLRHKLDLLKKKKRKRDVDSDGEGRENHKMAKASPAPSSLESKKAAHGKVVPQPVAKQNAAGFRIAEDFSEPSTSTLPHRPIPQTIPTPGPKKPSDVTEDFSKAKPPTQTAITTFYTSIDPWVRPLREDELGLLAWDGDTVEPYLIPPLGRHYTETWEEEDRQLYGYSLAPQASTSAGTMSNEERLRHNASWNPSSLESADLYTDERGVGPLTERLVSALIPVPNDKPPEALPPEEPSTSSPSTAKSLVLNTMDLEERVRGELMAVGLLPDEELDFAPSEDQILAELRRCQRELRTQSALNKARRERLLSIAQDRMAYQEYVDTRDVLDRQITSVYSKLQKRDSVKNNTAGLKKRKKPGSAAMAEEKEKEKAISPASLGLGPDANGRLEVSPQLMDLVRMRRQWIDVVGGELLKKQAEAPGRLFGLPTKSVYEGIEDDVRELESQHGDGPGHG